MRNFNYKPITYQLIALLLLVGFSSISQSGFIYDLKEEYKKENYESAYSLVKKHQDSTISLSGRENLMLSHIFSELNEPGNSYFFLQKINYFSFLTDSEKKLKKKLTKKNKKKGSVIIELYEEARDNIKDRLYNDADSHFNKIISLDSTFTLAHYGLLEIAIKRRKKSDVLKHYKIFCTKNPYSEYHHRSVIHFFNKLQDTTQLNVLFLELERRYPKLVLEEKFKMNCKLNGLSKGLSEYEIIAGDTISEYMLETIIGVISDSVALDYSVAKYSKMIESIKDSSLFYNVFMKTYQSNSNYIISAFDAAFDLSNVNPFVYEIGLQELLHKSLDKEMDENILPYMTKVVSKTKLPASLVKKAVTYLCDNSKAIEAQRIVEMSVRKDSLNHELHSLSLSFKKEDKKEVKTDEIIQFYEMQLKNSPNYAKKAFNYGCFLFDQNCITDTCIINDDIDKAIALLEKATHKEPIELEYHKQLITKYHQVDFNNQDGERKIRICKFFLKYFPDNYYANKYMLLYYLDRKNFENANDLILDMKNSNELKVLLVEMYPEIEKYKEDYDWNWKRYEYGK